MKGAQQALLMALEFRRDGLGFIAERIRTALGDEGDAANKAITEIAGQMQVFLASDVALPGARRAAHQARARRRRDRRPEDRDLALPARDRVAERADGGGPAGPAAQQRRRQRASGHARAGPARHGDRESTSIGDTTLQPDAPNRVTAGADTPIVVKFTNQGENDEFDVKVTVSIEGGDKPIKVSRTVDTIAQAARPPRRR